MEDVSYPRLCGGTFLNLLLQEKRINRSTGKEYPNSAYLRGLADIFDDIAKCFIISGVGGLGKSMMMKHLLLSAVSSYKDTGILPVLVSLKDYSHE